MSYAFEGVTFYFQIWACEISKCRKNVFILYIHVLFKV